MLIDKLFPIKSSAPKLVSVCLDRGNGFVEVYERGIRGSGAFIAVEIGKQSMKEKLVMTSAYAIRSYRLWGCGTGVSVKEVKGVPHM